LLVVDASGVVDVVLDIAPHSRLVGETLLEHSGDLHAPHLLDAEVGQVIRRYLLRRELRLDRAQEALEILEGLAIVRHEHGWFLARALDMRRNLSVYDALYVALAETLEAPLLTRDAGIARSAARYVEVIHIR
jgi:predicted nucleic acid-binding protein